MPVEAAHLNDDPFFLGVVVAVVVAVFADREFHGLFGLRFDIPARRVLAQIVPKELQALVRPIQVGGQIGVELAAIVLQHGKVEGQVEVVVLDLQVFRLVRLGGQLQPIVAAGPAYDQGLRVGIVGDGRLALLCPEPGEQAARDQGHRQHRGSQHKGAALLQKCFTVDFLTKKQKKNEGEVPQYYIENSHEAIIDPVEWEAVQVEMARRKQLGNVNFGGNVFRGRIKCGVCGGWYSQKTWHSTDPYKSYVVQCADKYKKNKPFCLLIQQACFTAVLASPFLAFIPEIFKGCRLSFLLHTTHQDPAS
ncbi:MAG: hypothetical protein II031_06510, partial [Bacteroidales bacterium]|nr:hypothetical protein [Bacteroidales bacterium]